MDVGDGYKCETCRNLICPAGFGRSGSCTGTNNGFVCTPCVADHYSKAMLVGALARGCLPCDNAQCGSVPQRCCAAEWGRCLASVGFTTPTAGTR